MSGVVVEMDQCAGCNHTILDHGEDGCGWEEAVSDGPLVGVNYCSCGNGRKDLMIEALKRRVEWLRGDPEFDGTDAAHPAWWRGNDRGVEATVEALNRQLDAGEKHGTFGGKKLEALSKRIQGLVYDIRSMRAEISMLRAQNKAINDTLNMREATIRRLEKENEELKQVLSWHICSKCFEACLCEGITYDKCDHSCKEMK